MRSMMPGMMAKNIGPPWRDPETIKAGETQRSVARTYNFGQATIFPPSSLTYILCPLALSNRRARPSNSER
jgi:hypothetical protein